MTPVTANSQWKPVTQTFEGVEMVLVPPGCFQMGSTEAQIDYAFELAKQSLGSDAKREFFDDEKPAHQVCFDKSFWIDKYEVTNGQFKRLGGQAGQASYWTDDDRPREQITWLEARDFCAKRGARLPTEAEWEYAARGPDSLVFPWGNDFVADNVLYSGNSGGKTASVGSKPSGVSWVGALDLSGNVWEWLNSLYRPYPYKVDDGREADTGTQSDVQRTLRGGSSTSFANLVRASYRDWYNPDDEDSDVGFRCARPLD